MAGIVGEKITNITWKTGHIDTLNTPCYSTKGTLALWDSIQLSFIAVEAFRIKNVVIFAFITIGALKEFKKITIILTADQTTL